MPTLPAPPGETLNGAAVSRGSLYTWGSSLLEWSLGRPGTPKAILRSPEAPFVRGGCVLEDGFVLQHRGRLVWLAGGRGQVIEAEADTPDVLAATLFGRRGVLTVHKYAQVRFYELPSGSPRDIYSIYTPSRQAGLILHDVDGEGPPDLFCGNYWIRAPHEFHLPWRLFAINTWSETPDSATVRLALFRNAGGVSLVCAQAEMPQARISIFEPPADPTRLWSETPLAGGILPRRLRGLAVGDFNGDGAGEIAIAEDAGPGSRVLLHEAGAWRTLATGPGVHTLIAAEGRLIGVGLRSISVWAPGDMRHLPIASPPGRAQTDR